MTPHEIVIEATITAGVTPAAPETVIVAVPAASPAVKVKLWPELGANVGADVPHFSGLEAWKVIEAVKLPE